MGVELHSDGNLPVRTARIGNLTLKIRLACLPIIASFVRCHECHQVAISADTIGAEIQ